MGAKGYLPKTYGLLDFINIYKDYMKFIHFVNKIIKILKALL